MSNSLWPHGLQHARLPCHSLSSGVCSSSCSLSWWCHPTISTSVAPFSSCLKYLPASGSFLISQLFASSGESIAASALASIFPLTYLGLISFRFDQFYLLAVQGTYKILLQHHSSKASIIWCSAFFIVPLPHLYMTAGKTIALTIQSFIPLVLC